jgi:predicted amidophosphoribosyltransferase
MAGVELPSADGRDRVVVPVPTTPERARVRGYNQAELLAHVVADALDVPLLRALERARAGPTQVALPPSQRRANVKGAFVARDDAVSGMRGTHVLLVDDVLTTGSTAAAAAVELARTGAPEITLVAFARALPFRRGASR